MNKFVLELRRLNDAARIHWISDRKSVKKKNLVLSAHFPPWSNMEEKKEGERKERNYQQGDSPVHPSVLSYLPILGISENFALFF